MRIHWATLARRERGRFPRLLVLAILVMTTTVGISRQGLAQKAAESKQPSDATVVEWKTSQPLQKGAPAPPASAPSLETPEPVISIPAPMPLRKLDPEPLALPPALEKAQEWPLVLPPPLDKVPGNPLQMPAALEKAQGNPLQMPPALDQERPPQMPLALDQEKPLQMPAALDQIRPLEMPPALEKASEKGSEVVRASVKSADFPDGLPPIIPASAKGCSTCGQQGGLPPVDHDRGESRCATCGGGDCVPGRKQCYPCQSHTAVGGFFCDLYECLCCPDPCYEPKWTPLADAAFYVDGARPQSQMRFGYASGRNLVLPDRSEFFWARADGNGKGPKLAAPLVGEKKVKYDDLTIYTETALGGFSTFVEMPYRSLDPTLAPHASGFTDMNVGTKSLIFDCELIQATFQFRTYIPIGNTFKGLGNGHVSLEPSLLIALKLSRDTYFQGQLSEWIPLGGDPGYAGSIFHSHLSLNHVLCRILPDVPLIATFELNTWSFQHGQYTDPILGPFQQSSGQTYVSAGPGLRLFVCDRIDFGVGTAFAVTSQHFAATEIRAVFRFRF